jgi:hypothetical protein
MKRISRSFIIIVLIFVVTTTAAIMLYYQQAVLLHKVDLVSDHLLKHDNSIAELFRRAGPEEKYHDPKEYQYEIKNNQLLLKKKNEVVVDDLAKKTGEEFVKNYATVIAEPEWRPYIYFALNKSGYVFQYDLDSKKIQKMTWTIDIERFYSRTPDLSSDHGVYIVANRIEKNNPNEEIRSLVITDFIKGTQEITTPLKSPLTYTAFFDPMGGDDNPGIVSEYGQQMSFRVNIYFDTAPLNMFPLRNPIYESVMYF